MKDQELENLQNDIATAMQRIKKPKKAVVTAGMPYANGPLHIGHWPELMSLLIFIRGG